MGARQWRAVYPDDNYNPKVISTNTVTTNIIKDTTRLANPLFQYQDTRVPSGLVLKDDWVYVYAPAQRTLYFQQSDGRGGWTTLSQYNLANDNTWWSPKISLATPKQNIDGKITYRIYVPDSTYASELIVPFETKNENPANYTGYKKDFYDIMKPYCPIVYIDVDTEGTKAGSAHGGLATSNHSIEVRSGYSGDVFKYLALHECAHLRQGNLYPTDWPDMMKRMNAIYGTNGAYNGDGHEQNADCVSQQWGATLSANWGVYTTNCSGDRGKAAKYIANNQRIPDVIPADPAPPQPVINPSIKTAGDVIAKDSDGALWNYSSGKAANRYQIGSGWNGVKSITVVDWNSDGTQDLLAQWNNGLLTVYLGKSTGGFNNPITVGSGGWGPYTVKVAKWKTSDKYPSVIARDPNGGLWYYPNTSGSALSSRTQVGSGWNGLDYDVTDWDNDGKPDILAVNGSGNMLLYRTDGNGGFLNESRPVVGAGWNGYSFYAVKDFKAPGVRGLLARDSNGSLWYYGIQNGGGFVSRYDAGGGDGIPIP